MNTCCLYELLPFGIVTFRKMYNNYVINTNTDNQGEKWHLNEMMSSTRLSHWNNRPRVDMSLYSDTSSLKEQPAGRHVSLLWRWCPLSTRLAHWSKSPWVDMSLYPDTSSLKQQPAGRHVSTLTLAHWNNSPRVDMSLYSDTSWFRTN